MNSTTTRRIQTGLLALLLGFLFFGCYPPPKVPIDTLRYEAPSGDHNILFIYLPGNGDAPDVFDKKGLLKELRLRMPSADCIAVNAHLGYYLEGSVFDRLKQDVIDPAKARGYSRIWFVGNSLGGYGSISYARLYPEDVSGIVMLGPYLGDRKIIREIREAGGLKNWDPGEVRDNSRDGWETELWRWVKDAGQQQGFWYWISNCDKGDKDCPSRIYLGYGARDRFALSQEMLAESIPRRNVFTIDGGHDWRTWKKLWRMILDRMSPIVPPRSVQAGVRMETVPAVASNP